MNRINAKVKEVADQEIMPVFQVWRMQGIVVLLSEYGRGVDLGEQRHRRREIWLCKFRLKYSTLVKQPRQCCRMGNLKCEEKSGIEVKISESSP